MPLKTVDLVDFERETANLYLSIVILSKRARQIASNLKAELDARLKQFEMETATTSLDSDEERPEFNEEQAKVSLEFELMPKPTQLAMEEMLRGEIYFRLPERGQERSRLLGEEEEALPS
ncbi:MAG: DNA-directed RNA polymerase subunit omega [Bacteroidetes bacterium]|nr:DNA-directed RNA polymerase subunit omega [Rhodothermia bacterium]MCS7154291.1 DNA-directed RNA polymerase subunit omega [Bacteroidota bacterium]MCX7906673.1 DNA-directed RNA polymerase subunit omega [Bacteroidota bacterium]MDW8137047.1 DNA-directed RNA polymerase subunit omega [Bacteroidota bacterium]MDW8285082.1 DNA-directed RNA polymerase subunit omega [Bacteroidota bacterium]